MNWTQKDKQFVWHPFTQMQEYKSGDPVVIEDAEGVKLYDTDGNEYYDGVSSLWLNVHGHKVDEIDEAIENQLDKVAHSTLLGRGNVPSVELAERLVEVTPDGLNKVFYSDSGATAVEIGMKMAIQYWANRHGKSTSKQRFLTFENGYHGDTFGPMSAVPDPTFHWPFEGILPDPIQVDFPHPSAWPEVTGQESVRDKCLERIDYILADREDEIAAVMVEPVQGAGGMVVPPDGFLKGLDRVIDTYDCFLIVDEVATGFARTGPMFACDAESVSPDIMPLGKGITGGYLPIAATMATDELYEQFLSSHEEKKALYHGHSYTGNALGCAAAIANLDLLEDLLPSLPGKIDLITSELDTVESLEFVTEFRQAGFMCGIELMKDPEHDVPFEEDIRAGWAVCNHARDLGMLIRPLGDVVVFMPPQASSESELLKMTDILNTALNEAQEELL